MQGARPELLCSPLWCGVLAGAFVLLRGCMVVSIPASLSAVGWWVFIISWMLCRWSAAMAVKYISHVFFFEPQILQLKADSIVFRSGKLDLNSEITFICVYLRPSAVNIEMIPAPLLMHLPHCPDILLLTWCGCNYSTDPATAARQGGMVAASCVDLYEL